MARLSVSELTTSWNWVAVPAGPETKMKILSVCVKLLSLSACGSWTLLSQTSHPSTLPVGGGRGVPAGGMPAAGSWKGPLGPPSDGGCPGPYPPGGRDIKAEGNPWSSPRIPGRIPATIGRATEPITKPRAKMSSRLAAQAPKHPQKPPPKALNAPFITFISIPCLSTENYLPVWSNSRCQDGWS